MNSSHFEADRLNINDYIAIMVIGGVAIIGILGNGMAMYILYNGGKLTQAFQQLCFSHSFSNFIALVFFLFYCTPMVIMQSSFSHTSVFAKLIGGFMVALWDVSVYSHLMSSVNRLIVITWPVRSREFLHQRNSTIMISIVWLVGLLHFIPYLNVEQCYIVFYSDNYLWAFSENYCGYLLGKVLDFGTGVSVFLLILFFDLWTLFRIQRLRKDTGITKRSRTQDIKFFIQTCIQFLLFVVKLCCFYFLSTLYTVDVVKYHMEVFFTTSFVWECCHCMDGLVLIPFHLPDYLRKRHGIATTIHPSLAPSFHRISRQDMSKSQVQEETDRSNL